MVSLYLPLNCVLYTSTGRRREENTQADAHPNPQEVTENQQENIWIENAEALEHPKSNSTGVQIEGISSESMEKLIKE